MPATSQAQRAAAGMALAAKRGTVSVAKLSGAAKQMYESMTEEQLEEFAHLAPKRKGTRKKGK